MRATPPVYYEEENYKLIKALKEKLGSNWHDFFLDLVRFYIKNNKVKGGK